MSYLFALLLGIVLLLLIGVAVFSFLVKRRVERGLPAEGRFVTIMGNRIHYVEQGAGAQSILLVHGLGGVSQNFSYGMLGDLARDYRVIAIDRPGSGYSERAKRASASLVAQADVVAGVIDALQLEKPLLVGHSLGGAVALATAQRYPDKLRGLALIAPLTHMPSAGPASVFAPLAIRQAWLRWLFARTLMVPLSIRRREQTLEIVFGPESAPADFALRGGGASGVRPTHFEAASKDLVALEHVLPQMQQCYERLQLPVHVLYGRGDRILNPTEQGKALVDRLEKGQLELIDGGHMLPITQPARSVEFVRKAMDAM